MGVGVGGVGVGGVLCLWLIGGGARVFVLIIGRGFAGGVDGQVGKTRRLDCDGGGVASVLRGTAGIGGGQR